MISRIIEISKRSNQYIANLQANIVRVVESNSEAMIDFNRSQMIGSKDADGSPLIHARTGKQTLSKAYAKRTGKTKPNLFVNGQFQDAMLMIMPNEKEYFIGSKDYKTKWLSGAYGKIFGVAPSNQPEAQKINDSAIINDYFKSVFQ
jgi:hypothetical protein